MEKLQFQPAGAWEQSFDPALQTRLRVDSLNALEGNLTGYDCPVCRNRGSVAYAREDGSIVCRECGCMPMRRCVWEMERSGLAGNIREMTFDRFRTEAPWQEKLKAGVEEYAKDPTGWLLVCGQSGSGKTHLCTAVSRKLLLEQKQLRYMSWREQVSQLKAMALDSRQRGEKLEQLKTVRYLYIDDLYKTGRNADGNDLPSGADVGLAFEILNYRYINHLPTIISTERTAQELVAIDEAVGSRIIEAAGRHVYSIQRDSRRNYRLRNVVNL